MNLCMSIYIYIVNWFLNLHFFSNETTLEVIKFHSLNVLLEHFKTSSVTAKEGAYMTQNSLSIT